MTLQQTFLAVLGALVVLFSTATAYGSWRAGHTIDVARQAWIAQLNTRIRAAWAIVVLFTIAFAVGQAALVVVFALASFFALREMIALTPTRPSDHWALVLAFYVVIPVQYVLVASDRYGLFTVFIPVYVFLVLPVVVALRHDTERFLERVAKVQWGLMISVYCVSHAPAIATLEPAHFEGRGPLLLLYFLLIVQMFDLFAVFASAAVGRTPLASNPSKSREGVLLGAAAALLLGTALWWMTPFTWWQSALMAAVVIGAAFLGGLVLDSVKRSLGARTWAGEIQLSRGVLERLEGLIFAAPVFFHITLFFFAT
ncbi:MAG TPA: phosphatidate cytidylyltransferase [Burkholderiaceae bacterium]|nr:phosphatidate cytidylyltransferase [Burkholderiaceae bacterium]